MKKKMNKNFALRNRKFTELFRVRINFLQLQILLPEMGDSQ